MRRARDAAEASLAEQRQAAVEAAAQLAEAQARAAELATQLADARAAAAGGVQVRVRAALLRRLMQGGLQGGRLRLPQVCMCV